MNWEKVDEDALKKPRKTKRKTETEKPRPVPPDCELGSLPIINSKREKFCQLYVKGTNLADAYERAGYATTSHATALVASARLVKKVEIHDRISYLQKQIADGICTKQVASKQELAETLTKIIRTTMSDFMSYDKDGEAYFELNPETVGRDAVKKIKSRTIRDEHGQVIYEKQLEDVELVDKLAAIDKLAKLMGYDSDASGLPAGLKELMGAISKSIFKLPCDEERDE